MPPRNAFIILTTAILSLICHMKAERSRYSSQIGEAMKLIEDLYLEDVKPRELFENAMDGMASGLDQYSQFIRPDEFRQMEQLLDQEFGGVGIEVEKVADDQPIIILSPLFGSPAYRAGLRAGDAIVAIDGISTIGLKQQECVPKMRGKPGSQVSLRIRRPGTGDERDVMITREVIQVDSLLGDRRNPDGTWDYRMAEEPRIGLLRLTTFGQHSAEELQSALGGDECPFDAVILDLRYNAGGLLDAAVETCDLFIDGGRIVSTRGRDRRERSVFDARPALGLPREVPLVILINKYSASASEIVAACLQDHQRAVVIGERTWGKGTVQNLLKIEGGRSALKLTTASYWRPSGKNIHRSQDVGEDADWGVRPDPGFEVRLSDEEMEQVRLARRQRDLGRDASAAGQPTPESSAVENLSVDSAPDGPSAGRTVDDRQLRKAVEYLQERLKKG